MRPIRVSGSLVAAALVALAAAPAMAEPPKTKPQVTVRVLIAHAMKEGSQTDPRCEQLRKRLGPMRFGSLRAVQERQFLLHMGENGAMVLPTGARLRVVPLSIVRKRLNVRVEVPGVVNTRLQMTSGRPVIVGGPRHSGGHLIVEITPEY